MKYLKITFLKKLAFSGLVFIILLVIAEVVLSWFKILPNDYYTNTPNTSQKYNENPSKIDGISGFYEIGYDALGSRSVSDYAKAKHKIVAIGGSTTICSVLTQEKTWTALLDKKLGDSYWVGNFARSGNSSNHHILQLQHLLDKPELKDTKTILMLVGVNDCRGYLIAPDKYMHMPDLEVKKSAFMHIPNSELPFLRKLTLFKLAKKARQRILFLSKPQRPLDYLETFENQTKPITKLPELTDGLNHYEHNLIKIIKETRKRNISIIFMTQPTIWKKNLSDKYKTLLAARAHYNKTPLYTGKALNKIMTIFNKRLMTVCDTYNVPVLDLQLPKNQTIFYDDMHFNESGAEIVAEKVYQFLKN
ncbi:GDSL-type esterase/lipase family protein [Oceanihabitans sp. 2_MG-2023]|uniref:SGNH/GDSL hydrolase family protein n=1 Tax=Oceanihabitans sp. 2_MG-2023 TaxID=3062661 RepID=UPI0026E144A3|nr:GDSL-type esterase/lipase family protein [Oceanihabitans sp. 2_MG-2023]MDO6596409.1 GDSL-type esterase/lipase family protein [Oceanihabitans sp. 2_MG-2023]